MSIESLVKDLVPILRSFDARAQELERRIAGAEVKGKVVEVNPSEARVRLEVAKDDDDQPVLSPWVPYKQTAGAMKFHNPPSVGQVMVLRSETGDLEQGVAEAFHWSDDNPANSTDGEEHKMTFGDSTAYVNGGGSKMHLSVAGGQIELYGGNVYINC